MAEALMIQGWLSLAEAAVWADALALLVVLLSRVVDEVTAGRVRRALLGRMGAAEDRLATAVEEVFQTAVEVQAEQLPTWAETGIVVQGGRRVFGKHTLDLDAGELADRVPWPPITVMTFQVTGAPAGVLLEIGPGGLPHRMLSHQAGGSGERWCRRRTLWTR